MSMQADLLEPDLLFFSRYEHAAMRDPISMMSTERGVRLMSACPRA